MLHTVVSYNNAIRRYTEPLLYSYTTYATKALSY